MEHGRQMPKPQNLTMLRLTDLSSRHISPFRGGERARWLSKIIMLQLVYS